MCAERHRLDVSRALLLAAALAWWLPANAAQRTFDITVTHGTVPASLQHLRADEGDVVTLRFSSDQPLALHLHGYDIEWRVEPGKPASVTFTARLTGRFPVHAHDTDGAAAARAETALVYVDVYPR